jgi:pimeloyl-ACP methyl ester carboxylesterase
MTRCLWRVTPVALWAFLLAGVAVLPQAQSQTARDAVLPREHFQNADVFYDWVSNSRGEKLRTFITRPRNAAGKVPVIFFVGWLSCDSMEYPDANTRDGFGQLIRGLIETSGYATMRMNKPGVGESQGVCEKADFRSELEGWRAAFDSLAKYDFMLADRVFVLGMSNGGGFSPLAAGGRPVRAYISAGSWGRTWYEHMLELERRRMEQDGKSPAEVNQAIRGFAGFYDLYLNRAMTPGQVLASHPEWKDLWYDAPDGQYGRPAAFYQQLQGLNLGEEWQKVTAPVLVIRGGADTIMSRNDSEALVQIVNQSHPGNARYVEIEGMDHGFTVGSTFHQPLVPMIVQWMKEH